jgi:hypothetical protein
MGKIKIKCDIKIANSLPIAERESKKNIKSIITNT